MLSVGICYLRLINKSRKIKKMNCLIIETVSFKLAEGVSDEDFVKTTEAVGDYLQTCDGFSQRRLSKSADGRWLEHVEWENLEKAEAASKSFMEQETIMPYMQSIDPESVEMQHQKLHVSLG